jgi:hypothetical protein
MKVLVTNIKVEGFEMTVCGAATDEFPDKPYSGTIGYDDFADKEDWRTVLRLLTQAATAKAAKNEHKA